MPLYEYSDPETGVRIEINRKVDDRNKPIVLMREKTLVMRIGDHHRVTPSPALFAHLTQLLGPGCLTG